MSDQILKQIIREVIQEQMTAFRQIQDFDKKFPWMGEVISGLSQRIASTKTQVSIDNLGEGDYRISFTGPPDVLLAILDAFGDRYVSAKHNKPQNPWNDSTMELVVRAPYEEEEPQMI